MHAARRAAGFFLAAASLVAAEDLPAKKNTAATEDVIAAAKRDLETIKAMRGPSVEVSRGDTPHFSVPEMQLGAGGPTRAGATAGIPKAKTANWLVDAMAKRTEKPTDGIKTAESARENVAAETVEAPLSDERPQRAAVGEQQRRDATNAADAVSNPLAVYMAGWMTPQDYKLLKPTMGAGGGAAPGKPTDAPGQSLMPSGAGNGRPTGELSFDAKQSQTPANARRENPFLQVLAAPVTNTGALPPRSAQAPQFTPAAAKSLAPVAPAQVVPPSTKPAFAKPPDDTKYFKPLKKF